ncbi:hypothetical protein WA171_006794, partial [Blastocystis sp. BT1]
MEPIAAKCDHQEKKYQVEPLQLLPGISLHDLSIIRACASKRQIPPSMKDLLLITLRDHLENLQKRKASITQNYAVMSKYEDEIGFRRQRDVKEILRLHSISEALTTEEYHAALAEDRKIIRITRKSITDEGTQDNIPTLLVSPASSKQHVSNKRNKVLEIPFSEEPALPSLDIVSMKRRKRARSQTITSDLFYPSYYELSPTDFSVLTEYWNDVECCSSPLDPEMVRLFLGLADFPSLESERTDTPHNNSSAIDSLMSCLIPENEAEVNKSLQEIQEYYTKNSDRIKKRLNSEGVYEEDPWIFRTLSRYKDHLNVYVQDELESLGLWNEEQTQDSDIYSNAIDENIQELLQLRAELRTLFTKYKSRLLEEVEKTNR